MKMSEDKKLEFQANRWANNKERSLRNKWYAIGRIDLLIISISGAGIYSCFEIIKFMYSNKIESEFLMLKIAGALFVFSILLNFISQFASEYSNDKNAIYNNKKFNDPQRFSVGESCFLVWTEFNFSKLENIAFPKISIGFLWKIDQLLYFRVLRN